MNVVWTATVAQQIATPLVPTGTATFNDGLGDTYAVPVAGGTATLILQPPAGTYQFTAVYGGDSNFAASPVSSPVSELVEQGTSTSITISSNPAIFGQPVTLTATVAPPTATGRVTFYDHANFLGVAPLSNGTAAFTTSLLQSGLRNLTARYDGDANDPPSTSAILTVGMLSVPGSGFAPPGSYNPANGAMPNSVVVSDFNGDGLIDVAVVDGATNSVSVFLNCCGGTFYNPSSYPVGAAPVAAAIGDFNADGKPDIAVASSDGVDILYGNGDGTFQPFITLNIGSAASGIAMGDFNKDGIPDLVAANAGGSGVAVLLANSSGNGTFQAPVMCTTAANPMGIAVGDFNGDGTPDIAVASASGVSVLLGSANVTEGTYACPTVATYPAGSGSQSVLVKDVNGDGIQDLAVTNFNDGTVSILLGKGDGTFLPQTAFPAGPNPTALASGDLNGDGKADLVVSSQSTANGFSLAVLLGFGNGSFGSPLYYASDLSLSSVAVADFNGDGKADVATVSPARGLLDILLNGFPTVTVVQGDTQSAAVYTAFPTPLQASATGFGAPAANVAITFQASNGFFEGLGYRATVLTNANGIATAPPYIADGTLGGDPVSVFAGGNIAQFSLNNTIQPCTFTVSPASLVFDANGGGASFTVAPSASNCVWSAATSDPGIQIGNPNGSGAGTVNVLIPQNTSGAEISESISIAGQSIPVQVDATAQVFADVLPSAYYFDAANLMYEKGITSGCGTSPLDFCPSETVTRAEMAIFLVRSIFGGDNFPYPATQIFNDVPSTAFGFKWIQELSQLGITTGCGANLFCPNDPVTRAQMAIFVIRMRYGSAAQFDYLPGPFFTDVPANAFGFAWIQRMRMDNITSGCSATLYCPDSNVLRQDMAIFIMRGGFNQLLPPGEPILLSVSPSAIPSGQTTTVTVTGLNTTFDQGLTVVNVTSPNVSAGMPTVTSATSFTVPLTATATSVPQSIWVTTSGQEAVLPNGLIIQ
jgi:hypothetical protein